MVKCPYKDKCLDYPHMCTGCEHNEDEKQHYYIPKSGHPWTVRFGNIDHYYRCAHGTNREIDRD